MNCRSSSEFNALASFCKAGSLMLSGLAARNSMYRPLPFSTINALLVSIPASSASLAMTNARLT
jgi:hypothetical protein